MKKKWIQSSSLLIFNLKFNFIKSKPPLLELGPVITPEGVINSFNIVKKAEYGLQPSSKYPVEIRIPPESYLPLGYDPMDRRISPNIPKKGDKPLLKFLVYSNIQV